MPSAYNDFVKSNYAAVKDLPPKERLAMIAKMWNSQKVNTDNKDIKQDKVKADKPVKANKPVKDYKQKLIKHIRGGALLKNFKLLSDDEDDDETNQDNDKDVVEKLLSIKSDKVMKGGYQQRNIMRPSAMNANIAQQLILKQ